MKFVELIKVGGIAALVIVIVYLLLDTIIRKNIFPRLTSSQAYKIIMTILVLVGVLAILAWLKWWNSDLRKIDDSQLRCPELDSARILLQETKNKHLENDDRYEDIKFLYIEDMLQKHLDANICDSLNITNDIETAKQFLISHEKRN